MPSLSLIKILSGLSKILGITKEFLPIYRNIKPIASKIPDYIAKIKPNYKPYHFEEENQAGHKGPTFFQ